MDDESPHFSIVDELADYLSGEMLDEEAPEFLFHLHSEPELLSKAREGADAIDYVENFFRDVAAKVAAPAVAAPAPEAHAEPTTSWHTHHRPFKPRRISSFAYRIHRLRKYGADPTSGRPLTESGGEWSNATEPGTIELKESSGLEILLELDYAPRVRLVSVSGDPEYWGEVDLLKGKCRVIFDRVGPGTYRLEVSAPETEEQHD